MTAVERDEPRISINQLAQYLVASPLRRRRIIAGQKRPPTFMVNWYEFAKNVIASFVVGGCADEDLIVNEIDRLYAETPANAYEETRYRTNAEALTAFLESYDELDFGGLAISVGDHDPPQLQISGVAVSVRPEFTLDGEYRRQPSVGALKLYFSKDQPLNDQTSRYITSVVHRYVAEVIAADGVSALPRHACVLDVFAGVLYTAPAATSRRFQELNAACQEIALWWPIV